MCICPIPYVSGVEVHHCNDCSEYRAVLIQEIDELFKIFRVLGTPNEKSWPGVSEYPDWKDTFPKWKARSLAEMVPTLDPMGVDVLSLMLRCA